MGTELIRDNMNIFRAYSEGMHNDNSERLMETVRPAPYRGAVTIVPYEGRRGEGEPCNKSI